MEEIMLNWLKKIGNTQEVPEEAPNPRQITVSVIKRELDEIARALFEHGRCYVDVRYKRGSAELFTQESGVVARVTVFGENDIPDLVAVECCNFSSEEEDLFSHYLQRFENLRVEFRVLQVKH